MPRTPPALAPALPFPPLLQAWAPALHVVVSLIALVASAFGCATVGPTVRLAPATTEGVTWANGMAVVQRAGTEVRVSAGFEQQDVDSLVVQVAIENQGAPAFEVDPRWIAFTPCLTSDLSSCMPARWAHDPEHVLASLDARSAQAAVDASNAQAALTILAIFSAVADVASVAQGRPHHRLGLGTMAALGASDSVAYRHQGEAQALDSRRQTLAATCLRRTTLAPGQSVAGRVLLPIELKAHYLWLHLRAGGQKFTIPFTQTVTPDPDTMANASSIEHTDRRRPPGDRPASAGFLH